MDRLRSIVAGAGSFLPLFPRESLAGFSDVGCIDLSQPKDGDIGSREDGVGSGRSLRTVQGPPKSADPQQVPTTSPSKDPLKLDRTRPKFISLTDLSDVVPRQWLGFQSRMTSWLRGKENRRVNVTDDEIADLYGPVPRVAKLETIFSILDRNDLAQEFGLTDVADMSAEELLQQIPHERKDDPAWSLLLSALNSVDGGKSRLVELTRRETTMLNTCTAGSPWRERIILTAVKRNELPKSETVKALGDVFNEFFNDLEKKDPNRWTDLQNEEDLKDAFALARKIKGKYRAVVLDPSTAELLAQDDYAEGVRKFFVDNRLNRASHYPQGGEGSNHIQPATVKNSGSKKQSMKMIKVKYREAGQHDRAVNTATAGCVTP